MGAAAELSPRRRKLILAICCLSLLIVGMDVTIVNVALFAIHRDLHAGLSGLQWTIDAYTLVLASLLMLSGSTADRLGRRRTFQLGLAVFTIGSLLCSLAPGLGWLVAFRVVQALGGSMLNPVAMSIVSNVFTEAHERAVAIGVWSAMLGISIGVGPVVGGLLLGSVGWRGIFWINIPIGIAAIALTALFVPESRAEHARRPDPVGQVLVIAGLGALTYAIIEAPRRGWSAPATLGTFAVAALAVLALVIVERRRLEPLLELRFFRSVPFSTTTLIAVATSGSFAGYLFLNTLYLQDIRGMSALRAGLYTLPMAVVTLVSAPLSGYLVGRRGMRVPLLLAGVGVGAGGLMLVRLSATTPLAWLLASYVVFAFGFAMANAPVTNSAVSGMPRSRAGLAAAVASTSRQVGSTLGVAVIGSLVNTGAVSALGPDFTRASHLGWWLIVGCGAVILVLGLLASSPRAVRSAIAVAADFDEQLAAASPVSPAA